LLLCETAKANTKTTGKEEELLSRQSLAPQTMGNIVTTTPNQVAVISGPRGTRMIIGGCGFQLLCIETCHYLSLELMTLEIKSHKAETIKGVRVNCGSVAQIKVKALMGSTTSGEGPAAQHGTVRVSNTEYDYPSITLASTHFLGESDDRIRQAILRTMEGHQRQILGTLTVEEIYKDRAAFSERVRELVHDDLKAMGFELVSYTVTHIDDENGYMESLGATQTELVKREAAEGRARNQAEARKKVAQYDADAEIATAEAAREAHIAVNQQQQVQSESDRDLHIKQAAFETQVNKARAEAEAAGKIEKERQQQNIVREKEQQRVVEAQVHLEITDRQVERTKKEAEGQSLAELLAEKNKAEAVRVNAQAQADQIRMIGEAEAAAKQAAGAAEAHVLEQKAEAWKEYGDAALVQLIVDKLPELASAMAEPLKNTKEMVFVSNDGKAASSMTGDIATMMSQVPATVKGLTGVDIRSVIQDKAGGTALGALAGASVGGAMADRASRKRLGKDLEISQEAVQLKFGEQAGVARD